MITLTELEHFLSETFQYGNFQDYCQNGLQVEGKEIIKKMVFGVSFNLPFLEKAIEQQTDAIIVHHGIFGKDFFRLKGAMKEKIKLLLSHDISLFGIHLPMDAHEQYGNNAQLLSYLDADILESFDVGFIAQNSQQHSLSHILDIFHQRLQPKEYQIPSVEYPAASALTPTQRYGFLWYENGPKIPKKIAIISGGSSRTYRSEALQEKGVDTYICGSVDEAIPAVSYETKTNFVNIGHYWSEKPGPRALKSVIDNSFDVETVFIDVDNVV